MSQALSEIEIRPDASGAPNVLVRNQPAPLTISLSHRDGLALCVVTQGGIALGCDLELIEPRTDAFIADYFTVEERAWLASAPQRDRLAALLWSAKESALKALRVGLRADTRSVAVTEFADSASCDWQPLRVRHAQQTFDGWWRQSGEFVRTVAASPPPQPPIALTVFNTPLVTPAFFPAS